MAKKAIVATKVGMTQLWDDDNRIVPVTMLRVSPARIVQVKTEEQDGYSAVQVTFGQRDPRKLNRPEAGHFDSAGVTAGQRLVELRIDDVSDFEVGQELAADLLEVGEKVDVNSGFQRQGFCWRYEASQLCWPASKPWCPQGAPCSWRHWRLRDPWSRIQGHQDGWPYGS